MNKDIEKYCRDDAMASIEITNRLHRLLRVSRWQRFVMWFNRRVLRKSYRYAPSRLFVAPPSTEKVFFSYPQEPTSFDNPFLGIRPRLDDQRPGTCK